MGTIIIYVSKALRIALGFFVTALFIWQTIKREKKAVAENKGVEVLLVCDTACAVCSLLFMILCSLVLGA